MDPPVTATIAIADHGEGPVTSSPTDGRIAEETETAVSLAVPCGLPGGGSRGADHDRGEQAGMGVERDEMSAATERSDNTLAGADANHARGHATLDSAWTEEPVAGRETPMSGVQAGAGPTVEDEMGNADEPPGTDELVEGGVIVDCANLKVALLNKIARMDEDMIVVGSSVP